jgi:hypothetical protein
MVVLVELVLKVTVALVLGWLFVMFVLVRFTRLV